MQRTFKDCMSHTEHAHVRLMRMAWATLLLSMGIMEGPVQSLTRVAGTARVRVNSFVCAPAALYVGSGTATVPADAVGFFTAPAT